MCGVTLGKPLFYKKMDNVAMIIGYIVLVLLTLGLFLFIVGFVFYLIALVGFVSQGTIQAVGLCS